jgi:hypothetical protein
MSSFPALQAPPTSMLGDIAGALAAGERVIEVR